MARSLLHHDAVFPVTEQELELSIPVDKDAVYHLRVITTETGREILKRHTYKKPNKHTHKMDDITDNEAASNDMLDYCIVRWDGVKNGADPAPCDLAHKLLLPVEVQVALVQIAQVGPTQAEQVASFRQSHHLL